MASDRTNRSFKKSSMDQIPNKVPEHSEYMKILDSINKKMASFSEIKENTSMNLSANANVLGCA